MAMTTNVPLLLVGNTTAQLASKKGAAKQVVVDTTKNTLVVMDGEKNGGYPLVKESRGISSGSPDVLMINGGVSADLSGDITLSLNLSADPTLDLAQLKATVDAAGAHGLLGDWVRLNRVNANTLIETGNYIVDLATAPGEDNWPAQGSAATPVQVVKSANSVYQYIEYMNASFARRSIDSGATWERWWALDYIALSNPSIYLSKNGSDYNAGLSPDYPVLTINRAMEIARVTQVGNPSASVNLCFGAGDWGNITFNTLPYMFNILPYDRNAATEYSDALPKFGVVSINNSYCRIGSIIADKVAANNGSVVWINAGYKKINCLEGVYQSFLLLASSADASNVWEIGQPTQANGNAIINLDGGSVFALNAIKTKLAENVTKTYFARVVDGAIFSFVNYNDLFNSNGHTFTGKKFYCDGGAAFICGNSGVNANGVIDAMDSFFGEGYEAKAGAIFNGAPLVSSLHFIDVPGDEAHSTSYTSSVIDLTSPPSTGIRYMFDGIFKDKNGKMLGETYYRQDSSGIVGLIWYLMNYNASGQEIRYAIQFTVKRDGTALLTIPNPPVVSYGSDAATTKWVQDKLGTGASLTALANIDETDEAYVETLEIKKQKAIAQINSEAQQAIYGGFPYEIDGAEYWIGYSLFDQQNLAQRAILAAQNPGKAIDFPCMDEQGHNVWLEVPTDIVLAIQRHGLISHTDIIRKAADEKKSRILAAQNENEIKAIIME